MRSWGNAMGTKEPRLLISLPVTTSPRAPVRKRTGRCDICGCAVWISKASPRVDLYRCFKCAKDTIDPNEKIQPPSKAQIKEIAEALRKLRH